MFSFTGGSALLWLISSFLASGPCESRRAVCFWKGRMLPALLWKISAGPHVLSRLCVAADESCCVWCCSYYKHLSEWLGAARQWLWVTELLFTQTLSSGFFLSSSSPRDPSPHYLEWERDPVEAGERKTRAVQREKPCTGMIRLVSNKG